MDKEIIIGGVIVALAILISSASINIGLIDLQQLNNTQFNVNISDLKVNGNLNVTGLTNLENNLTAPNICYSNGTNCENQNTTGYITIYDQIWMARGTVVNNDYWAMGNGQVDEGLPILESGWVASEIGAVCYGSVGTSVTVRLMVNQATSGCQVVMGNSLDVTYTNNCSVDISENDELGIQTVSESGSYSICTGTILLEKNSSLIIN